MSLLRLTLRAALLFVTSACASQESPPAPAKQPDRESAVPSAPARGAAASRQAPDAGPPTAERSAAAATCPDYSPCVARGRIESKELVEISGLAASRTHPGVLYGHNDSGDSPRFFALDDHGNTLAEFMLPLESVSDVEDIAVGPGPGEGSYVYLGDIGNNFARIAFGLGRKGLRVYRLPEPALPSERGAKVALSSVEVLRFKYPDHPHDAEALFIDPKSGDLYVVSKEENGRSGVYRAKAPLSSAEQHQLELVATLEFGRGLLPGHPMVTAADLAEDGERLLIRTYSHVFEWRRRPEHTIAQALKELPRIVPVPREPQGEAVAFSSQPNGYFTVSEGDRSPLYFCACNAGK